MTALNDLSRALSSRLNISSVDDVHRGVSRLSTRQLLHRTLQPDKHEVTFPLNVTESVADQEITALSADQGITGYIIRTRESVLIREDVNAWLEQHGMTHVANQPSPGWACPCCWAIRCSA